MAPEIIKIKTEDAFSYQVSLFKLFSYQNHEQNVIVAFRFTSTYMIELHVLDTYAGIQPS
jgi:hypothetical protein